MSCDLGTRRSSWVDGIIFWEQWESTNMTAGKTMNGFLRLVGIEP